MTISIQHDTMLVDNRRPAEVDQSHLLTGAELDALAPEAQRAFELVERLRKGETIGEGTPATFFHLPYATDEARRIKRAAKAIAERCDDFVVLGIGGSALGTIAVQSALRHPFWNLLGKKERGGRPRLFVLDNVDPDWLHAFTQTVNLKRTVFNVITKSGSTSETMAQFVHFRDVLAKALGPKHVRNLVITTDFDKGLLCKMLDETPEDERYETFDVPEGVGGRFSVLSAVGLLPLAVAGVNIDKLLAGAREMDAACKARDWRKNPALRCALLLYAAHVRKGQGLTVMMPYSQRLRDVADWFRQLWAESLGKRVDLDGQEVHAGLTPIKALGVTDQHSQVQLYAEGPFDKVVVFVRVERFDKKLGVPAKNMPVEGLEYLGGHTFNELIDVEQRATQAALVKAGRPTMTITLPKVTAETVGELLYLLEMQTAYAGALYNINTFNQPGVEQGKQFTYGLMGRDGYGHMADEYHRLMGRGKGST